MRQFLSCDWGTSSFRLKLIETNPFRIVAEVQNNSGISATHSAWQLRDAKQQDRFLFYASVIGDSINELGLKVGNLLSGVPVVVSGMASSSLGMINLPYKHTPFKTDGSDLELLWAKPSAGFSHDIIILSGVCSDVDVMRGEETQLVGAIEQGSSPDQVFILPGTHSKHITVQADRVIDFKTYMTGELFALLCRNSTLTEAVQGTHSLTNKNSIQHFIRGVKDSTQLNLLHNLFRVRTQFLLQKYPPEFNNSYLSGLLIGSELRDLVNSAATGITLVSSSMLERYELALQTLQVSVPVKLVHEEEVTVRGQLAIVAKHPETRVLFTSGN